MRSTCAILFAIIGTALATAQGTSSPPVPPVIHWLRANAVPLQTTDPEAPLDDLEPLREIVGNAQLVSLGEPIHGSRDIHLLTRRFVQFLVEHLRFNVVAFEMPYPIGLRFNEYVSSDHGNSEDILVDLLHLDKVHLIRWLRKYNHSVPPKWAVRIYAIDVAQIADPDPPVSFLCRNLPHNAEVILKQIAPLQRRSDSVCMIPTSQKDQTEYQEALETLLTLFDRYRVALVRSSSRDAWQSAREHAVYLQQAYRFLRRSIYAEAEIPPDVLSDMSDEIPGACKTLLELLSRNAPDAASAVRQVLREIGEFASMGRRTSESIGEYDLVRWRETLHPICNRAVKFTMSKPTPRATEARERARDMALRVDRYLELLLTRRRAIGEASSSRDQSMAQNLEWIFFQEGRGARVVVCAHNGHVSRRSRWLGSAVHSFGGELDRWSSVKPLVIGFSFNRGPPASG
ncbi:MAG: erythromycin esterase family protein [Polyangiaceae bacterium]|nr:erythromycin esterase family protein [Polyangiaceae bacterium]